MPDTSPLERLKKALDLVYPEMPVEDRVRHHLLCVLVYRNTAVTYPAVSRQALLYAIDEQKAARRAKDRAEAKLERFGARSRDFAKIYRPFEPRNMAEVRVLLALSKPEHRWDYKAWLDYYTQSARYYARVIEVSRAEQERAVELCRRAMASVEQYQTLIESAET